MPSETVINQRAINPSSIESPSSLAGSNTSRSAHGCGGTPSVDGLIVHVLGYVSHPGSFWVTPGTRVDQAISCADGILASGSTRNIQLRHNGSMKFSTRLDLFAYRNSGDIEQNPYVSNEDVIFVPPYQNKIKILGNVKRSGSYELLPAESTINAAISLAGGFSVLIDPKVPVTLLRAKINDDDTKPVTYDELNVSTAELDKNSPHLQNGDILVANNSRNRGLSFDTATLTAPGEGTEVPTALDKVFVTGDVKFPGAYPFAYDYTLTDYAKIAGPVQTSNLRRLSLISPSGQILKKSGRVSPGDLIYVPSKRLTFSNALQLWSVTTSTFFTGFSIYSLVKD